MRVSEPPFPMRIKLSLLALALYALASCGGASTSTTAPQLDPAIPVGIQAIMAKPRYAEATWSLLVTDLDSGESFYALNPDRLSFTGSTRKLFSVGLALNTLGPDFRTTTTVQRLGPVDPAGSLNGDLVLVAGGDLTFGGRRSSPDVIEFTNFDHNDANNLGTAILTPQDPLFGLDQLAAQVRSSGITAVTGEVAIDDRLFQPYRVPNGNLLVTPIMVNENQVDVTLTPTQTGQPAAFDYRPRTAAFTLTSTVVTNTPETVEFSNDRLVECAGVPGCSGTVQGDLPSGYVAPLSGIGSYVGTFRVEDPAAFARTAFIEALQRQGIAVQAPVVAANNSTLLPLDYPASAQVAAFRSAPYAQDARLILKVSLNLGANLALSLFGLSQGQRTIEGSLAVEREALVRDFGLDPSQFEFPTNGSGSPDSQASPRALVGFLVGMARTPVARTFQDALPVLGVDGSLATTGTTLPGRGHVFAKTGTTVGPGEDGTPQLVAQNLAGYIETRSGRRVAYALLVNNAGALEDFETDIGEVFQDEATISSLIYENL